MSPTPTVDALVAKLSACGIALAPGPVRAEAYGDSSELSIKLLSLMRSGRKRAATFLLWACEHDGKPIAKTGDIEIVLDHLGKPALVTRIIRSEIVPYCEVTAEYAAIEGEGDGSLEYWRKAQGARRIGHSSPASASASDGSLPNQCPSSVTYSRSCMSYRRSDVASSHQHGALG
jgi:uncharacterized protein YhfF